MRLVWGLTVCLSCTPNLAVDRGTAVSCASDAECPEPYTCALGVGRCVLSDGGDDTPPLIESAVASSRTLVLVTFSEPVAARHVAAERFGISPSLAVSHAGLLDDTTVQLTTATQVAGLEYTLEVSGLPDAAGNAGTSSTSFAGFGEAEPPEIIAPALHELIFSQGALSVNVPLSWLPRLGAESYTVEVATDVDFSQIVDSGSVPTTTLAVDVPAEPVTLYWRVRSDITTAGAYSTSDFDVLTEGVHVYCADGADCDDSAGLEAGNQTRPYRSVQRGILAAASRHTFVRVAGRGGAAVYEENLSLVSGVDVFGGYDPSFSTSNPALYPTRVRPLDGPALSAAAIIMSTVVSGMELVGPTGAHESIAVVVTTSDQLHVTDCVLRGGEDADNSTALLVTSSAGVFTDNQIVAPDAASATLGVQLWSSGAELRRNQISAGHSAYSSTGLRAEASFATIADNDITAMGSDAYATGLHLVGGYTTEPISHNRVQAGPAIVSWGAFVNGGDVKLEKNLIGSRGGMAETIGLALTANSYVALRSNVVIAGPSLGWTTTVRMDGAGGYGDVVLSGNTLVALGAAYDATVIAAFDRHPVIVNNLLAVLGTAAGRVGIDTQGSAKRPVSVQNNLWLVDPPPDGATRFFEGWSTTLVANGDADPGANGAYVYDGDNCNLTACTAQSGGCDTACPEMRVSGNLTSSGTAATLFLDSDGADNDLATPFDNDFRLLANLDGIATAGMDPTALTCGTYEQDDFYCGDSTQDFNDTDRDAQVTIGAFELVP